MSVVHNGVDSSASFRGEWDWVVPDWSVNNAGLRKLLPSAGDCSGIAGEPRIMQEVGNLLAQFIYRKEPSPLVARLIRSAQHENPAEEKVPPEILSPQGALAHIPIPWTGEPMMVCFSCGRSGHRVSRCSRKDTAFSFLPPGWSVDFRDGQYRAVWPKESPGRFQSRNED